jgi:hypothetical protein
LNPEELRIFQLDKGLKTNKNKLILKVLEAAGRLGVKIRLKFWCRSLIPITL